MYGKGLIEGFKITWKNFWNSGFGYGPGVVTEEYPDVKPYLPPRFRGNFEFELDKCIACSLCMQACPNKRAIQLTIGKDENNKRKMDGFVMDLGYCLFCGLCVEACPTDALRWVQEFELACYMRDDMVQDMMVRGIVKKPETVEQVLASLEEEANSKFEPKSEDNESTEQRGE